MPRPTRFPPRPAGLLAVLLAALAAGCSGPGLYPVEGVVQFDDGTPAKVLAGGTVSVEGVDNKVNASGEVRPDGTFRLLDPLGKDGAPAGRYRVIVLPPPDADRRNPPVDPRFGRYETSGLELTVTEAGTRATVTVPRPKGVR